MSTPMKLRLYVAPPSFDKTADSDILRILETRRRNVDPSDVEVDGSRAARPRWVPGPSGTEKGFDPRVEKARETLRSRLRNAPSRIQYRLGRARRQAGSAAKDMGDRAVRGAGRAIRFSSDVFDEFGQSAAKVKSRHFVPALLAGGVLAGAAGTAGAASLRGEEARRRWSKMNNRLLKGPAEITAEDDRGEGWMDEVGDTSRRLGGELGGHVLGAVGGLLGGALLGRGARGLLSRSGAKPLQQIAQNQPIMAGSGLLGAGAGTYAGALYGSEAGERSVDRKYSDG